MTPREGVSRADVLRVAEAIGKAGKFGAPWHEYNQNDQRGLIEMAEAAIAAHPAATAREEAWKAMVEALTYIASHRGLTLLGDGSYSDGVRDGWIELADAADRALALARSTGGEHA